MTPLEMIDKAIVYAVKRRELPEVVEKSPRFSAMNEQQAKNFRSRLRYIEEITLKIDEWLSTRSLEEHQAFIDRIELDLSINLSIKSDPDEEVSPWLIHSSWTFDAPAGEMKARLSPQILALLDQPIPSVKCTAAEFRTVFAAWNEGIKLSLDRFYSASTFAEAMASYIAIDTILVSAFAAVLRGRLNEPVLKNKE